MQAPLVFNQDASVRHYDEAGGASLRRRLRVFNAELHPGHFGSRTDGAVYRCGNFRRTTKNIPDLNRLRHCLQPGVAFLAEDFGFVRIHGNDPVARRLHVFADAEAGTRRIRREADDTDRVVLLQNFSDGIRAQTYSIRKKDLHSGMISFLMETACAFTPPLTAPLPCWSAYGIDLSERRATMCRVLRV